MKRFNDLFGTFTILGLIVLSLFSFSVMFQSDNNVSDPFIKNSLANNTYSELNNNLKSLRDDAQTQKGLFESENPTSGFGSILLFSIVSSGKVFSSMTIGLYNTLIKLPTTVLGLDVTVVSVISTLLIVAIITGLWMLYKLGG